MALAELVKQEHPDWQIYYLGVKGDKVAGKLIDSRSFTQKKWILAGKWHRFGQVKKRELLYFWRKDFWLNLGNAFLSAFGFCQSVFYLKKIQPQLIFSKGGYVAVPPCLAARFLKIPLVIHDSDTVFGLAHSLVQKYALLKLTGFKVKSKGSRHVGIPVNPLFAEKLDPEDETKLLQKYGLPPKAQIILVTGGGGGARSLNQAVLSMADELTSKPNVYIVILTGSRTHQETVEGAGQLKRPERVLVFDFIHDMPDLLRASLGVVTRAGATILTEVSLAQKAAIIVPNPLLPRAHQVHNARLYQRAEAAWLVSDTGRQVNIRALRKALSEMINDPAKRLKHQRNIAKLALPDATKNVLQALEDVLSQQQASSQEAARDVPVKTKQVNTKLALKKSKSVFKYALVIAVSSIVIFKIFYVEKITLNLTESSPLISSDEFQRLEGEIEAFVQNEQNFFQRHFFVSLDQLRERLLNKNYIQEVVFERNFIDSQLSINLKPKYILGSLQTPNLKTIITTDGYAISDYQHLANQEQFALEIISPYQIIQEQQLILSGNDLLFLNEINAYLASRGYKLVQARISTNPREIILRLKDYEIDIIALSSEDPVEQGIALASTLEFFERSERVEDNPPEDEEPLQPIEKAAFPQEYIDIRLVDRVIFK